MRNLRSIYYCFVTPDFVCEQTVFLWNWRIWFFDRRVNHASTDSSMPPVLDLIQWQQCVPVLWTILINCGVVHLDLFSNLLSSSSSMKHLWASCLLVIVLRSWRINKWKTSEWFMNIKKDMHNSTTKHRPLPYQISLTMLMWRYLLHPLTYARLKLVVL